MSELGGHAGELFMGAGEQGSAVSKAGKFDVWRREAPEGGAGLARVGIEHSEDRLALVADRYCKIASSPPEMPVSSVSEAAGQG
jgi:hypothetical protein